MQYETIILEMLSRIKALEEELNDIKEHVNDINETINTQNLFGESFVSGQTQETSVQYTKMTDEMVDICYRYGKLAYENQALDTNELADKVVEKIGMNHNSAIIYIYVVKSMLNGEAYKRAINMKATEIYFQNILKEYGKEGLLKAINSTKGHIKYRQSLGHTVNGLVSLCKKYE